jgi:D-alanyl-lipoteichoic acid acyltransferase DltB (MBOAT superfamily)
MAFNTPAFALFLSIVFFLNWFPAAGNLRFRNLVLLAASYLFYGWWDWRFLILLFMLSFFNYIAGIRIDNEQVKKKRKAWLVSGLIFNIGILVAFKYFNYFLLGFHRITSELGMTFKSQAINIILPLGLSFYVFMSLSYIIDVYRRNMAAEKDAGNLLLSLGFFPIILAGPIQRPSALLPQIRNPRVFTYERAADGLKQVLWGLFAKMAVADNLSGVVDGIFSDYGSRSGSTLLLGAVLFAVQIYADFSGYSNIAIGIGKLLGFNLIRNFDYPYFSRDITQFWKKWHISLTSWFRDYVFFPLSVYFAWRIRSVKILFIRKDHFIYIITSLAVWFLTGLWHGAGDTFIVWGMFHGMLLIAYHLWAKPRRKMFTKLKISSENPFLIAAGTLFTLLLLSLTWVFFRSVSVSAALQYIAGILSPTLFSLPENIAPKTIFFILILFLAEWMQRRKEHPLQLEAIRKRVLRWAIYYTIIYITFILGTGDSQFIYFQF